MTDYEFLLKDRIAKIKAMNETHDLEKKSYVSFSGGKDSAVLSSLVDLALPGNNIPRIFFDTGLEYRQTREYVLKRQQCDSRVRICRYAGNVQDIWRKFGYPFKSKQHSHILHIYQNSGKTKSVRKYLCEEPGKNLFACPEKLKYQFSPNFEIKVSDMCCTKLKKQFARRFEKESGLEIAITGVRAAEGGQRKNMSKCAVFSPDGGLKRFSPLLVISDEWVEHAVADLQVPLSELYEPPFNFQRTGCAGCPYALDIAKELKTLMKNDLRSFRTAFAFWKPVYEEYCRINYRGMRDVVDLAVSKGYLKKQEGKE